jgi:hypothetical protein
VVSTIFQPSDFSLAAVLSVMSGILLRQVSGHFFRDTSKKFQAVRFWI